MPVQRDSASSLKPKVSLVPKGTLSTWTDLQALALESRAWGFHLDCPKEPCWGSGARIVLPISQMGNLRS